MLLAILLVALLAVDGIAVGHRGTGDSQNLVLGTRTALGCIGDGVLHSCGVAEGAQWSAVYPYPLLQYLPAALLVGVGLKDGGVLTGLAWLSLLSFVAIIGLTALGGRRFEWRGWTPILILTMVASPLVYQSTSAFGEAFAGACVLAAVVAALHRRPLLMALAATAAPLGKETLLPFVVVLMLLAARERTDGWMPRAGLTIPIAIGAVASALISVGFNLFRFGTLSNVFYLKPLFRTPGSVRKIEFTSAIWVSPNGGLAWFWPLATAIFAGVLVTTLVRLGRREGLRSWGPPMLLSLVVAGFSVGLAAWWAPFGWISYGNRLMVPFVPAAVLVAVAVAEPELTAAARRLVEGRWVFAVLALGALMTFPQTRAAWSYGPAMSTVVASDDSCTWPVYIETEPARYYDCVSNSLWRLHPSELWAAATHGGPVGLLSGALGAGVAIALVLAAREAGRPRAPHDHGEPSRSRPVARPRPPVTVLGDGP